MSLPGAEQPGQRLVAHQPEQGAGDGERGRDERGPGEEPAGGRGRVDGLGPVARPGVAARAAGRSPPGRSRRPAGLRGHHRHRAAASSRRSAAVGTGPPLAAASAHQAASPRHTAVSTVEGPPMSAYTKSVSCQTSSPQATSAQSSARRSAGGRAAAAARAARATSSASQPPAEGEQPDQALLAEHQQVHVVRREQRLLAVLRARARRVAARGQRERGVPVAVLGEALQPDAGQRLLAPHVGGRRPQRVPVGDRLVGVRR